MVKITYVPLRNNYRPNRALEILKKLVQVCLIWLELNFAGQRHSRTDLPIPGLVYTGLDKANHLKLFCHKKNEASIYCRGFVVSRPAYAASSVERITDYNGFYSILSCRTMPLVSGVDVSV